MKWNDLIQRIMEANNGVASIQHLYRNASKFRRIPAGDWQKTLRGVLYREVGRGRFKKIGLGVYALAEYKNDAAAYSYALQTKNVGEYLRSAEDCHSIMEGMLIELGNYFGYVTYTSDLGKTFDGKRLADLCQITDIPDFTYPELKNTVAKSDAIWFVKSRLLFPKVIFEVEATTDFTNSMFKMYQLIHFDASFILVARASRDSVFRNRVGREPFVGVEAKFSFRSFEAVTALYFSSVQHYELRSDFLAFHAGGVRGQY